MTRLLQTLSATKDREIPLSSARLSCGCVYAGGRLDATQKGLGILPQDGLAESFARIAQDQAKDPSLPLLAFGLEQRRPAAEVHLHFFPRFHFNPLNKLRIAAAESTDVALNRLIGTGEGEPMLGTTHNSHRGICWKLTDQTERTG